MSSSLDSCPFISVKFIVSYFAVLAQLVEQLHGNKRSEVVIRELPLLVKLIREFAVLFARFRSKWVLKRVKNVLRKSLPF